VNSERSRPFGLRRLRNPRLALALRAGGPFVAALVISLIVFKNRKEVARQFFQIAVVWAPVYVLWKLPVLRKHWKQTLVFLGSAALSALALHLVGPVVLHKLVLPLYNLDVDHRNKPLPGFLNEDGIKPDVPPSAYRPEDFNIIFLGDSMTEGLGLDHPEKQAFPFLIEQQLRAQHPDKHIRVADFGWSSSSPVLENRQLKQIGWKYHPKLVVQVFDMTDFQDDVDYTNRLRRADLEHPTELSISRAMLVRFSLFLGTNDFVQYLKEKMALPALQTALDLSGEIVTPKPAHHLSGFEGQFFFMWIPLEQAEPFFKYSWQAINETYETAKSQGAKFAFFVLPRYQQYNRRESPKDKKKGQIPPNDDYLFGVFRYFERQAVGAKFPVHHLLRDYQTCGEFPTTFEDDFHINETGHKIAARAMLRDLTADGLLDPLK